MSRKPANGGSRSPVKGRSSEIDKYFADVIASFANDRAVVYGGGKGFGSAALKVDGKIFAMMSSRGAFVVKLPRERVAELVSIGRAQYFNPGSGKLMQEWAALSDASEAWTALAREARQFVQRRRRGANSP